MTQEQVKKEYDENGYVVLRNFFNSDVVDKINNVIDEMCTKLTVSETVFFEGTKIKQIQYLNNYDPLFQDIIDQLTDKAQLLTGQQNLKIHNMQLFEKHPGISKPTRAHQDNAYFRVDPANAITFWISLDEIDDENGCLYYANKSHLQGNILHKRFDSSTTFRVRSGVPGLSLCIHGHDETKDTAIHTKKGDIVIHHCNLVHRAGKNISQDRRRRAIGIIYIPTDCKPDDKLTEYYNGLLLEDIEIKKIRA